MGIFAITIFALCLVSTTVAVTPEEILQAAEAISVDLLQHFKELTAKYAGQDILDVAFPILPPLPDPVFFNDSTTVIPPDSNLGQIVYGTIDNRNTNITGFSQLFNELRIAPAPDNEFILTLTIKSPYTRLAGEHDANLTLVSIPAPVLSHGDFSLTLTNVFIQLNVTAKVLLKNSLLIRNASLDLSIENIHAYTTETLIDGEAINWDEFNEGIDELFPQLWEKIKANLDPALVVAFNAIMKTCKLTDIIKGDFKCLEGEDPPEILRF